MLVSISHSHSPVDKLDGLLQGVGAEDTEHRTEDLILISLHTWSDRRETLFSFKICIKMLTLVHVGNDGGANKVAVGVIINLHNQT